ncbi:hypothetical protein, partial [Pararcticibacter amylolyticus]|uniref:hypothetical protein n=1 Tax=Pararcticibacter amylolyticus TaxID=2173175 RepID=UPI001304F47F
AVHEKKDEGRIWKFKETDGHSLIFEDGTKLLTTLFDLKYIGQLKTNNKAPYLILSGRDSDNCDENMSVFIWCPDDGPMKKGAELGRYSYPGRENDYLTGEPIFESKMYYGNCMGYESCIWLQKTLNDKKVWEQSVFIVKLENNGQLKELKVTKAEDVKNISGDIEGCTELPGVTTTSDP